MKELLRTSHNVLLLFHTVCSLVLPVESLLGAQLCSWCSALFPVSWYLFEGSAITSRGTLGTSDATQMAPPFSSHSAGHFLRRFFSQECFNLHNSFKVCSFSKKNIFVTRSFSQVSISNGI